MDIEIIQKYKVGGGSDYTLVYKAEGKDDPFGDNPISNSEELSGEIGINLAGEVTMATTMDDDLEKLLDSYGGGEDATISAYTRSQSMYSFDSQEDEREAPAKEDDGQTASD